MHIVTVEFVGNTEDAEAVRAAYKPVMDVYGESEACLGTQILQNKSRRERTRFLFQSFWRSREEAVAYSSRPDVVEAHDKIYAVQTPEQKLSAWGAIEQRGILATDEIKKKLAEAPVAG
jgi:quinol monooxygenase YgiN